MSGRGHVGNTASLVDVPRDSATLSLRLPPQQSNHLNDSARNIHPAFDAAAKRTTKEALLNQRARVIWLYGLSGSGKSTLAVALEERLHADGYFVELLDGDNVRGGLNQDLGFADSDRMENIRRISEVAKLFLTAGAVTVVSFITPKCEMRDLARSIVGPDDFTEVFVKCSFETCQRRDVKGLYAKANAGALSNFTGKDSSFEPGEDPDLVLDTENSSLDESLKQLYEYVLPLVRAA